MRVVDTGVDNRDGGSLAGRPIVGRFDVSYVLVPLEIEQRRSIFLVVAIALSFAVAVAVFFEVEIRGFGQLRGFQFEPEVRNGSRNIVDLL